MSQQADHGPTTELWSVGVDGRGLMQLVRGADDADLQPVAPGDDEGRPAP